MGAVWTTLYDSGTLTGVALLCLIVIAIVLAAQLEALFSACRHLVAHRKQLTSARRRIEADTEAALKAANEIDLSLSEARDAITALVEEYERLELKAIEARRLHIREVVVSDTFILPGDRPYLAKVTRPKAEPDEPFAPLWRAGRDHVVYGSDRKAVALRFSQRFPVEHGFVIGPISPFDIPQNPPEELPTLDQA